MNCSQGPKGKKCATMDLQELLSSASETYLLVEVLGKMEGVLHRHSRRRSDGLMVGPDLSNLNDSMMI